MLFSSFIRVVVVFCGFHQMVEVLLWLLCFFFCYDLILFINALHSPSLFSPSFPLFPSLLFLPFYPFFLPFPPSLPFPLFLSLFFRNRFGEDDEEEKFEEMLNGEMDANGMTALYISVLMEKTELIKHMSDFLGNMSIIIYSIL